MALLEQLLGNQQRDHDDYRDFTQRYERGAPWDDVRDDEVLERYERVGRQLPPDLYEESAQEAFSRMSPAQRREYGEYLDRQSRDRNLDLFDRDGDGRDDRYEDPGYLAQATSRMHQQQPDLLGGMLGGMLGGGSSRSRSNNGGGGGMGDMLSNPIAKAALAGITAVAAKKMMDRR